MVERELWGHRPGGRAGSVSTELVVAIKKLISKYGDEAVAQVAALESGVLPVIKK